MDMEHLRDWIGREERLDDVVTAARASALAATLDRDDPWPAAGDPLPPLWHWTLCVAAARQSALGPDGHAARGGFLPPVPLPRRMWAGGHLGFPGELRVGDAVQRRSRVVSVDHKRGRTGALVFVVVRHEYHGPRGLAITEDHDIVYRELPGPGMPAPEPVAAPSGEAWRRTVVPDEVLLFRYSALTFNGHRIHYDRRHATTAEGYAGLIVHGPLVATLLLDLLRRNLPKARISAFDFRAVRPLFDVDPFALCGRPADDEGIVRLWACDAEGRLAMEATATLGGSP